MSYKEWFEKIAKMYSDLCEELYKETELLGERIILQELLQKYGINAKRGLNMVEDEVLSEICIEGRTINLISHTTKTYKAYVLYFEKEFNFPYLGFEFKKDIISPHFKDSISSIALKYNEEDLIEIIHMIEERIKAVETDLEYIKNKVVGEYKYFYREYRGLFDGIHRFNTFEDVLKDFCD